VTKNICVKSFRDQVINHVFHKILKVKSRRKRCSNQELKICKKYQEKLLINKLLIFHPSKSVNIKSKMTWSFNLQKWSIENDCTQWFRGFFVSVIDDKRVKTVQWKSCANQSSLAAAKSNNSDTKSNRLRRWIKQVKTHCWIIKHSNAKWDTQHGYSF